MKRIIGSISLIPFIIMGCGTEGTSSNVSVQMSRSTSFALDGESGNVSEDDIVVFDLKPLAVRISEDNAGGYMIWGANNCPGEKGKTTIDDKEYEYYSEHNCTSNTDNSYLDLTDASAVNEELNSQAWPIPPGTYHYVSLIMCGQSERTMYDDGSETNTASATARFQVSEMDDYYEYAVCNPFGGYSEEGIVIPEGGTLTIDLSYDLGTLLSYTELDPFNPQDYTPGGDDNTYTADDGTVYSAQTGVTAFEPSIASE